MQKTRIISLFISLLMAVSCTSHEPVFEKYKKFDHNTWDRFNQILFTIPIREPGLDYDVFLVIKPVKEFAYNDMPVYIIMDTPSGEERMKEVNAHLRENNKFIGEVEGKPAVIKVLLWKALRISDKGSCKISVENMIPKIQTSGIAEIGIEVEKSK